MTEAYTPSFEWKHFAAALADEPRWRLVTMAICSGLIVGSLWMLAPSIANLIA
jgi:hypothetical protein